ncbi:hypothetical protein PtB15_6B381 [Puccinia triticina]|nr:hypothetical protein PtB15_6B381 [Puccinia triticina]
MLLLPLTPHSGNLYTTALPLACPAAGVQAYTLETHACQAVVPAKQIESKHFPAWPDNQSFAVSDVAAPVAINLNINRKMAQDIRLGQQGMLAELIITPPVGISQYNWQHLTTIRVRQA